MANFFECSRHGQDRELEYRIIAADGRTIWVREGLRPVLDRNGHVEGVRGVMWNIGRRKKIERQLQVARSELADQLADVMHLHDLSRRLWATPEPGPLLEEILVAVTAIQGAEMGMVQLYRRPEADLEIVASVGLCEQYLARYARVPRVESAAGLAIDGPGPVIIEDVETEPTACAYREEFRTGGYRAQFTTVLTGRTGEILATVSSCFREAHRPPKRQIRLIELFVRQAGEFVENARLSEALRAADRRKNNALAALAHELRNPLSAILYAAHALKSKADTDCTPAEIADLIMCEVKLMTRLANDLDDATRDGPGELVLKAELLDIESVMARAVDSLRPLIAERRQKLKIAPPQERIRLEADPVRLEQVLVNLLINACRYSEPGGTIVLEAHDDADGVKIRVKDTGIGIRRDMLERIFDPFVRVVPDGTRSSSGMGLGLALVRRFVERHGGTVTASSDGPGRGSEFIVRLPKHLSAIRPISVTRGEDQSCAATR